MNLDKINILKRDKIKTLINDTIVQKYFDSIIIFGSSIRSDCTNSSDIDMLVSIKPCYKHNEVILNKLYIRICNLLNNEADIFFEHEQHGICNANFYKNAKNGVRVL